MSSARKGDKEGGPGDQPDSSRPKVALPLALSKLPPGRHNLPREFVVANQRTRLLSAALTVFGERGFVEASVAGLTKEAGTSRSTFYSLFSDKAACFLATYELALEWLEAAGLAGVEGADGWPLQVRDATENVLSLLAENPRITRVCAVEARFAGAAVEARQGQLFDRVGRGLGFGRRQTPEGSRLTALLEPALVFGAAAVIGRAGAAGDGEGLAALAPELNELFLTPYLGRSEARRIARRG